MDELVKRLNHHVQHIGRDVPGCWKHIDHLLTVRGKGGPDWPDWCFIPISGTLAVVKEVLPGRPAHQIYFPAMLAGLAAWRVTKGLYVFDETVLDSLWDTPIEKIPSEFFYRLPEWCVYIPTPGKSFDGKTLTGFFVHLESDANTGRPELRFLLDMEDEQGNPRLIPLLIHLDQPTLDEGLRAVMEEAAKRARQVGVSASQAKLMAQGIQDQKKLLPSLISLTLYLCSENAEIRSPTGDSRLPARPKPKKTKQGERFFEGERMTRWDCGWRIGHALRRALDTVENKSSEGETGRQSPRPHIRRAHYHHFWMGSGERRTLVLKWVHPILVNVRADEDLPAVVRTVAGE